MVARRHTQTTVGHVPSVLPGLLRSSWTSVRFTESPLTADLLRPFPLPFPLPLALPPLRSAAGCFGFTRGGRDGGARGAGVCTADMGVSFVASGASSLESCSGAASFESDAAVTSPGCSRFHPGCVRNRNSRTLPRRAKEASNSSTRRAESLATELRGPSTPDAVEAERISADDPAPPRRFNGRSAAVVTSVTARSLSPWVPMP